MLRRTKIVATLGPATDDPKVLDEVIAAGVDVVRLNMSHGTHEDHERRADWVRNRARASGRQVGVLIDLQGPKIRIEKFENGFVNSADTLRDAMNKNPHMRVLVLSGYFDLATPYFAADYTFSHMGLTPSARRRLAQPGGSVAGSRAQLRYRRYTALPPTKVIATSTSLSRRGSSVNRLSESTTKSASFPTVIEPLICSS